MTAPAPTVTAILPKAGYNDGSYSLVAITGTAFVTGAAVTLELTGEADIVATAESVVSSTEITCTIDLTGAEPGLWDVVVTNADAQVGTLTEGFTVTAVPTVLFTAIPRTVFSPSIEDPTHAGSVRFFPSVSGNINPIVAYDWDFGDGYSGTDITPIHAYPTVSAYTSYYVTLTIAESDAHSSIATVSDFIAVDIVGNVPAVATDGTYEAISVLLWDGTNQMLVNRNPWAGSSYYLLNPVIKTSIDKIGTMTFTLLDAGSSTAGEKATVAEGINIIAIMGQTCIFSGLIRRVTQNSQTAFTSTTKMQMWDIECDSDLAKLKKLKVAAAALALTPEGETIIDSPGNVAQRILT